MVKYISHFRFDHHGFHSSRVCCEAVNRRQFVGEWLEEFLTMNQDELVSRPDYPLLVNHLEGPSKPHAPPAALNVGDSRVRGEK